MNLIDQITNWISTFPPVLIYLFLFTTAFTENICPPIPGDTIVVFGAFLAGQKKIDFMNAYLCTSFGSWAGFMFVYWIGIKLESIKKKIPFFKEEDISKAEDWIKKYGYLVILVNRYLPGVRAVISITAGIMRLSFWKVSITSFAGCASWNMAIMYLGLKAGSNWEEIKQKFSFLLTRYNVAVALLLLAIVVLILLRKTFATKR